MLTFPGLEGKLTERKPGTDPPFPTGKASFPSSRQSLNQVLTFLGLIGVIVDPTTAGVGDSDRAMQFIEPWDDDREKLNIG